ncbi:MAG: hypothetical protein V1773_05115 [bacterium]
MDKKKYFYNKKKKSNPSDSNTNIEKITNTQNKPKIENSVNLENVKSNENVASNEKIVKNPNFNKSKNVNKKENVNPNAKNKKFIQKDKPEHKQETKFEQKSQERPIGKSLEKQDEKPENRSKERFAHKNAANKKSKSDHKSLEKSDNKSESRNEGRPFSKNENKNEYRKTGNVKHFKQKEHSLPAVSELKYFSDFIKRQIPKHIQENKNFLNIEPLALLEYEHELKIKESSLREFFNKNNINGKIEKITPSVKARNYRTTTKRKLNFEKGKYTLVFQEENIINFNNLISVSALEPVEHKDLYLFVAEKINTATFSLIAKSLNYLIIRGTYLDFTLIFNIHQMNADVVRKVKMLSDEIKQLKTNVRSVFVYLDPTKSDYYFESQRPDVSVNFKNIFGPDKILVSFSGNKYSFLPTSFSQVNESIVPAMLDKVKNLLKPKKDLVLIDLYSGYGLFSLYLADSFADVIGMEADVNAVKSAKENVEFTGKNNVRFLAMRVTLANIDKYIPKSFRYDEIFILDPPKMGTEDRVIQAVAQRNPAKVLHIFCGVDNIPEELKKWEQYGYFPTTIAPLDMFPGSPNLEVFVLLQKK